jgi:hypothetical protein
VLFGVASCTFDLDAVVTGDPTRSNVTLDGAPLTYGEGWALEMNKYQVTLQGSACDTYRSAPDHVVSIEFLCDEMGMPVFQTEMQANGFDTAVLIHHALVDGGASMYLQTALIGPLAGPATNASALVGMAGNSFVLQDAYFAMSHYSHFTDPGWVRVASNSATEGLLTSAWLAPARDALSVIFINTSAAPLSVALKLGRERVRSARLTLSAFDGAERMSDLGEWAIGSNFSLPARAVATVLVQE